MALKPKLKAKTENSVPLHNEIINLGFLPEYWKRSFRYFLPVLEKRINLWQIVDFKPAQRKDAQLECSFCGVAEIDKKLSCQCMAHICGNRARSVTSLEVALGQCKEQTHCATCCSCVKCMKCHKLYKKRTSLHPLEQPKALVCVLCNCCSMQCCACTKCPECGLLVGRDRCACTIELPHHVRCCSSNERIQQHDIKALFISRAPRFAIGTNFQHVRTRRLMSVETEILAVEKPQTFPAFNRTMRDLHCGVVKEGTVPNGFEINSNPASGDQFEHVIHYTTKSLTALNARINIRCGTHVHVDARDFHYTDLVNLIYLYHKIEPALFAMLPPWRRISRFAVPCREQLMKIANNGEKIVQTLRDPDLAAYYPSLAKQLKRKPSIAIRIAENLYQSRSLREQKLIHKNANNQHLRYMALNLHSWVYRRTVEFRHWPGSVDKHELICWAQICAALLDAAKRLPIDQARRGMPTITKLSKHPVEALLEILRPSSKVSKALRPFVEAKLQQWSPDFDIWWPIAQIGGRDSVLPFKDISHDELKLSFDLKKQAFTYINARHRANWEIEWLSPTETGGRYAELSDLHAIPTKGTLLWMAKNPTISVEPKPKPTTMYTIPEGQWHRFPIPPMEMPVLEPEPREWQEINDAEITF